MRESSSSVDIPTGAGGNREVPINLICGAGLQATNLGAGSGVVALCRDRKVWFNPM